MSAGRSSTENCDCYRYVAAVRYNTRRRWRMKTSIKLVAWLLLSAAIAAQAYDDTQGILEHKRAADPEEAYRSASAAIKNAIQAPRSGGDSDTLGKSSRQMAEDAKVKKVRFDVYSNQCKNPRRENYQGFRYCNGCHAERDQKNIPQLPPHRKAVPPCPYPFP